MEIWVRVSREAMARHHDEIVSIASKLLRQRGIAGVSVADVMQAAGLTHGGFYRHFSSKDALVAEATTATFDKILRMLNERAVRKGAAAALDDYVVDYLSIKHLAKPDIGCPIAAYAAEATREGASVVAAFETGAEKLITWIAEHLNGPARGRRERAHEILALMVGAVVLARLTGHRKKSERGLADALRSVRDLIEG